MNPDEPTLINQPTAAPTRKVQASAIGGALMTLVVFGFGQFGIRLPSDVVAAGAVVIVSTIAAYQTKNEVVR